MVDNLFFCFTRVTCRNVVTSADRILLFFGRKERLDGVKVEKGKTVAMNFINVKQSIDESRKSTNMGDE